jgi:glycosyltransferase involved in cell wall biosynthesis
VSNLNIGSQNIKIAYIHNMTYPSLEANALQAITMASAFSKIADTTFFMPRLKSSISALKQQYNISDSSLRIQPMYLDRLPSGLSAYYEQYVSLYLRFYPKWAGFQGKKILFVRAPKELLFWGLQRESQKWLRDWVFIFEAHDVAGLDPNKFQGVNPFELRDGIEGEYRQSLLRAMRNFDLVVCVTQALADDLSFWSNNTLRPQVIRHASFLPRISSLPQISSFGEKIVLGYIGTIDQYRGVNVILDAMRLLPKNYILRLVGRVRQERGVDPNWLTNYMDEPLLAGRVELINAVPIQKVAEEIDRCDLLLQPASHDMIDSRYASPLKSYDYMMRGKPIIAADVPGHHELFRNGENAFLYRVDPRHLADCITKLVNNPGQAEKIAQTGWKQSADYTYRRRAEKILSLV